MAVLYGISGILGPPTPAPQATPAEIAEGERVARERAAAVADAGREAWRLLHTKKNPTPEWFESWRAQTVPHFGCACVAKLDAFLKAYPVNYTPLGWPRWQWRLHDFVNRDLKKTGPDFAAAAELWSWG